jgi:hypothetical protein
MGIELRKFRDVLGFALVVVVVAPIVLYGEKRLSEHKNEWMANVDRAKRKTYSEVPQFFKTYAADIVLEDGTVEHWSAEQSELLFIDVDTHCEQGWAGNDVPCWTAWARTRDTHRYYKLGIKVDQNDGWRLKFKGKHNEVSIQGVVKQALKLGRQDVLKKLPVAKTSA